MRGASPLKQSFCKWQLIKRFPEGMLTIVMAIITNADTITEGTF